MSQSTENNFLWQSPKMIIFLLPHIESSLMFFLTFIIALTQAMQIIIKENKKIKQVF